MRLERPEWKDQEVDKIIAWGGVLLFCVAAWRAVIWFITGLATGNWQW